jgi:hypothetical protein
MNFTINTDFGKPYFQCSDCGILNVLSYKDMDFSKLENAQIVVKK